MNMLDRLESLLNKSLLRQVEDPGGEPRFTMLETLRESARERLEVRGEAEGLWQQLADYFLDLAEQALAELRGPRGHIWITRLEIEYENLRNTLAWLFEQSRVEPAVGLVAALGDFWFYQGHHSEGSFWLGRALSVLDSVPLSLHARVLNAAGRLTAYSGDVTYPF